MVTMANNRAMAVEACVLGFVGSAATRSIGDETGSAPPKPYRIADPARRFARERGAT